MTEIQDWQLDAVAAVMRRCDVLSDFSEEQFMKTLEQMGFTIARRAESREAPADQNFPRCEKASSVDKGLHCESWYWGNPEHACCMCGARRSDTPKPITQKRVEEYRGKYGRGPSADLVIHDEVPAAFFQRAAEEPTSPKCSIITAHDPHDFESTESRTVTHSCSGSRYPETHVKPEYRGKFPSETQGSVPVKPFTEIVGQVPSVDDLMVFEKLTKRLACTKPFIIHEPHGECPGVTNEDYIRAVTPLPPLPPVQKHYPPMCNEYATHLPHGECPGKESTEEDSSWILSKEADATAELIMSPEDQKLPAPERYSVWVAKNDVGRRRFGESIVLVDFNSLAVRFKPFPNGDSVVRTIGIMTAMYELCHLDGEDCPRHYEEILKASGRGHES